MAAPFHHGSLLSTLKRTCQQAFSPSACPPLPVLADDATSSDDSSPCDSGDASNQTAAFRSPSSPQVRYKGVRQRSWGRWVTEIREPATRQRVWLGSYSSAEDAARVYDMASLMLRGAPISRLNFPDVQGHPVTIPRSVAESLLKAVRCGQAARYAAGKPGATPPSDAPLTTFNSEHVRMEVVGSNVVLSECPLAPVAVAQPSSAPPSPPSPASSVPPTIPASPPSRPLPTGSLTALLHARGALPKLENAAAAAPSATPSPVLQSLPVLPKAAETPPEVAVFDAFNLSDEELFGSLPDEDVKPTLFAAATPDAAAAVASGVVAPAPFSAGQQEPPLSGGWLCLSDIVALEDDVPAIAPFSLAPNAPQMFAEDFWPQAEAPAAKKQRV